MRNRFDRQRFLGPRSDCVLGATRIGVAGVGGGGSHIVQQGARVGIGEFCVFDPDHRFDEREELEAYCRRFLIPYIDVGMDVHAVGDQFAVSGQVILSLPGGPCMKCMHFIDGYNDEKPAYLDAGARPQVIWPIGVLASTAVGLFMQLLTPWSAQQLVPYLEYDGNSHQIRRSKQLDFIEETCSHHPEEAVGDPFWTLPSTPIGTDQ